MGVEYYQPIRNDFLTSLWVRASRRHWYGALWNIHVAHFVFRNFSVFYKFSTTRALLVRRPVISNYYDFRFFLIVLYLPKFLLSYLINASLKKMKALYPLDASFSESWFSEIIKFSKSGFFEIMIISKNLWRVFFLNEFELFQKRFP